MLLKHDVDDVDFKITLLYIKLRTLYDLAMNTISDIPNPSIKLMRKGLNYERQKN